MKPIICSRCGASDFIKEGEMIKCKYCHTLYRIVSKSKKRSSNSATDTSISINEDIASLLRKCKTDPANARRYANRILDIDPTNVAARKYL